MRYLFCDLIQGHLSSRTAWAFDREIVAIINVVLQERSNNQSIDGHPDWAAPVGVPPKHAGIRLAWKIRHRIVLVTPAKHIGMPGVIARKGADAERTKKLVLIQHSREHPAELVFVQDGGQSASAATALSGVVDEGPELWASSEKTVQFFAQLGVFSDEFSLENGHRTQRQQSHDGPHLQPLSAAVGQSQEVIEKTILFVPHPDVPATVHQSCRNPQKVPDELDTHFRIRWSLQRQLHSDLQHVLGVQRHPRGTVRLLEVAAGWKWRAAVKDTNVVQAKESTLEGILAA